MPAAHRHKDSCSGHGCWPPRKNRQASRDVYVNGKGFHRKTDAWPVHKCDKKSHPGITVGGSGTVSVNDKPAARIGDRIGGPNCGGVCLTGSGNVFVG